MEPIIKNLELNCSIEHAFNTFTRKAGTWWPMKTHSCAQEDAVRLEIGESAGSEVIEIDVKGQRHSWGKVLVWDPPREFAMTWHPGIDPQEATKLTVSFEKLGEKRTRLVLKHEGWDARKNPQMRENYNGGWDKVLADYRAAVE